MPLNHFKNFAKISLSTYNLKGLAIDTKKALNGLSNEIQAAYEELNSEKVKTRRCNFFNIPNTEKEHYAEHLIDIVTKGKIICGIRHLNGQPDKAFVNILTDFETTKKELLAIYDSTLAKYFTPFNPIYIRYYTKQKILSNFRSNCSLVQHASLIKEAIEFEEEKHMNLISPESDNYLKPYVEEYEKFHQQNPELKNKVPCNNLKDMEACRLAGLLKEVQYNNKSIGIIAARREEFLGHSGIYFMEIMINEVWKGRGLAKAIQRKYIDEICTADEIVWGTIDMDNLPSFKTAKANLRKEVRYENFVKIDQSSLNKNKIK